MGHQQKDPLRELTADERTWLERISHSHQEPAVHVAHANWLDPPAAVEIGNKRPLLGVAGM